MILLAIVLLGAGAGLFSVQVALATACIAVGAVLGVAFFLLPKGGKQEVGNGAEIARLQAENDRLKEALNKENTGLIYFRQKRAKENS